MEIIAEISISEGEDSEEEIFDHTENEDTEQKHHFLGKYITN